MKLRTTALLIISAMIFSSCSLSLFGLPDKSIGETVVEEISVAVPQPGSATRLALSFGAGELEIHPGGSGLVSGTATYNSDALTPEIRVEGSEVEISQGEFEVFNLPSYTDLINEWDLNLGSEPVDLSIQAGAYDAIYEFGGIPLLNLDIQDGASDVDLTFSQPNPVEMGIFRYQTGASSVNLSGLANANFALLEFDSGAGSFTLDFSGSLQRDASVTVESGVGNLTLIIPEGVQAQITLESALSNVSLPSSWTQSGNTYTQEGSGPRLTISVNISAGNLVISH